VNRTLTRLAVLLTVAGVVCLPVAAVADPQPISLNNTTTSIASGDVFGAGHSNIVGSGDGGGGGVGAVPPTGQQVVRLQTGFDQVSLVSHTGDAQFPIGLPFASFATVPYADASTAVYRGMHGDYTVALAPGLRAKCTAPAGSRCEIRDDFGIETVIMG
jgi:hypothetical protein